MAAAETARLIASLELQDKNFTRGIRNVERGVNRVDRKLGAFSGFVNRNMARAIDSIGVHLVSAVGTGLEELATLEDATTSVTGAIGQVGKGWETTAEDIATWANEIEASTDAAFDDKAITASAATLIRYGKVSEDNLRPALEVMTDLAAKTGNTESAATLLGKALADPAKAAGKLARQGVILTKAQQKQIKAMVKAGDVAGAQTLLLDILSETTKDAAKNSAGPYRDALNKLGDAGEDLRRSFAVGLLPVIEEVSGILTTELAKPETLEMLKGIGTALADTLRSIIGAAKQLPWKEIGTSLQIAGAAAKTILDAFLGLPPWVQAAVISGWGLNKITGGLIGDLASGLIKGVLGINAGVVNLKAATVVGGGVPGGAGGAAGGASKLANAVRILGAVSIAGASLIALAEVFRGFQETVTTAQQDLLEKVNRTSEQGFKETVANLEATNTAIQNMNPLENVLAGIFGGSEIQKNLEMAADRLATLAASGELSQSQMADALAALKETRETNPELSLPETDAAIKALTAAINKKFVGPPKPETKPRVAGVGDRPSPGNPGEFKRNIDKIGFDKWLTKADNIKNAVTTTGADQKAELSNIKNATATMDTNTKAGLLANTTVTVAGNVAAAFQSASQVLATGSTTTAVNTNAAATRGVAPPITGAISSMSGAVVGAIWAARPVIQSTTVVNSYGTAQRGGATSDSRAGGGRHG